MPNGSPGDHPYTDIVLHGRAVYSATADGLVREIALLADDHTRRELEDMLLSRFAKASDPDIEQLELTLKQLRDKLRSDAANRGWETAP